MSDPRPKQPWQWHSDTLWAVFPSWKPMLDELGVPYSDDPPFRVSGDVGYKLVQLELYLSMKFWILRSDTWRLICAPAGIEFTRLRLLVAADEARERELLAELSLIAAKIREWEL